MTETTFIRKKMSFKCLDCELAAKIVLVDERRIDRGYSVSSTGTAEP